MKPQYFVPLLTYPDTNSSIMVANAVEIARHRSATLHSYALEVVAPELSGTLSPFLDIDALIKRAEVFSKARGTSLTQLVKDAALASNIDKVTHNLTVAESFVTDTIAEIARCYDLTIMEASTASREIVEAVLFGSGRPILICPTTQISGRFNNIVIAWDGSRAASRALADADDFLQQATESHGPIDFR